MKKFLCIVMIIGLLCNFASCQKNNKKTHLYFDISRERYYDTKDDSLFYLRSFFDFRNELYKQKYKEYFSKKEYQFNGFCM